MHDLRQGGTRGRLGVRALLLHSSLACVCSVTLPAHFCVPGCCSVCPPCSVAMRVSPWRPDLASATNQCTKWAQAVLNKFLVEHLPEDAHIKCQDQAYVSREGLAGACVACAAAAACLVQRSSRQSLHITRRSYTRPFIVVQVAVTKITPIARPVLLSSFQDRSDLIDALMTSCHVRGCSPQQQGGNAAVAVAQDGHAGALLAWLH